MESKASLRSQAECVLRFGGHMVYVELTRHGAFERCLRCGRLFGHGWSWDIKSPWQPRKPNIRRFVRAGSASTS